MYQPITKMLYAKLSFTFLLYTYLQVSLVFSRAISPPELHSGPGKEPSRSIAARQGKGLNVPKIPKALSLPEISYSYLYQRLREDSQVFRDQTLLFYTRRNGPYNARVGGLSFTAQTMARSRGFRTIWSGWPGAPAEYGEFPNGPISFYGITNELGMLREIRYRFTSNPPEAVPDDSTQTEYFRRMSAAFALQARGSVVVMTENPGVIRMDGIWESTEFPILRGEAYQDPANGEVHRNTGVDRIYATDEAFHEWYIIWDRNDASITWENPRYLPNGEPPLPPYLAGTANQQPNNPKTKRQACQLDETGFCEGMPDDDPEALNTGDGRYYMDFFG